MQYFILLPLVTHVKHFNRRGQEGTRAVYYSGVDQRGLPHQFLHIRTVMYVTVPG